MKNISEILSNGSDNGQSRENEYTNETDGLIYCSKCGTPKQMKIEMLGKMLTVPVMCRCRSVEYEKEQEERKKREHMEYIARLRSAGLQDKALRDYTFENDRGYNPEISKAHEYVEQWDKMKSMSMGLLLWGNTGTGKSFFAGCIANALIDKGIPVLMTNFARILNTLTCMYSEDRNEFIDSFNKYELLIIDDLGMERNSEFALEQVYNIIDSRYRSKKPLIITTNLTLEELKYPPDLAHQRIYDRVLERCVPLKINNRNIREMNAAVNMAEARKIFSGDESNDGR